MVVIVNFSTTWFLAPQSYLRALYSLHHFSLPPIFSPKFAPTWCPVLGILKVALVWSSLRVLPWVQQQHFDLASLVFWSSAVLFVDGVFALVWTSSACNCLESTRIVSCSWVIICNNARLILVRFYIASLSSIAAHASACSASAVLTWDCVSGVWFADAPDPWAAAVASLRIW